MPFIPQYIPYGKTGLFTPLVLDYLQQSAAIFPFQSHPFTKEGFRAMIHERENFPTDRQLLVGQLKKQYESVSANDKINQHIHALLSSSTFTVTTAHQPNIFTGHLYFIYKILHAIKLAEQLKINFPENDFVPVYYMGSEDADLEELGHIYIKGEKHEWLTTQRGAVGRMKVDKELLKLTEQFSGQLSVYPFGEEIISLIKNCYREGMTIESATFSFVHELFKEYGLLVLLPDNSELKRAFVPVMEKELQEGFSEVAVNETIQLFPKQYKTQVAGREINLFYMEGDSRERIIKNDAGVFSIHNTKTVFSFNEIKNRLYTHPACFSPNVILRPVFQEMILPNIAFIGGGGEISYWLELKKVFEQVKLPFPVLLLRNSWMILDKETHQLVRKLDLEKADLFKPENELMEILTSKNSTNRLDLSAEKKEIKLIYDRMVELAGKTDPTLKTHTQALGSGSLNKLTILEKKMLRAEKRKMETESRQLKKIRSRLFPQDAIQERVENFLPFYAKWGKDFIQTLYKYSGTIGAEFCILTEEK